MYVPKDRVTNQHQGYGFVEFRSEEDADYVCVILYYSYWYAPFTNLIACCCLLILLLQAIKVLNMIKLYGKPIRVNKVHFLLLLYLFKLWPCYTRHLSVLGYSSMMKSANLGMLIIPMFMCLARIWMTLVILFHSILYLFIDRDIA